MASTTARSRADDARVIELARLDDPATARELVASLERRGAACARLPPRGAARVRRLHASAREFFANASPAAKRACGVEAAILSVGPAAVRALRTTAPYALDAIGARDTV